LAPFLVMPKTATATSSVTPAMYSGTAKAIRRCGGTCATTNMMAPAISMLRPWSKTGAVVVARRIHDQQARAGQQEDGKRQQPVKALQHGQRALVKGRFVENGGHAAIIRQPRAGPGIARARRASLLSNK
jgi:hypothetical protein